MIDLAHNEARYIALLYRRLIRSLDKQLAPLGLSYGRYAYLFALYIEDGRSQQDLANSVGSDKAAAARAVSKLASDGLVVRREDTGDRRVIRVYLTAEGRAQRSRLEQAANDAIAELTQALTDDRRAELRTLLALACGISR